jgi:dsDNA-specific endonuclease/ATPase MutS2
MTPEKLAYKEKTMADSLVQLEFAKVVKLVVAKTQTTYGRTLAEALSPFHERPRIEEALREAKEAGQLLQEDGPYPLAPEMTSCPIWRA